MTERDHRLVKARRHDHALGVRLDQRPADIDARRPERRDQRRLAPAAAQAQARVVRLSERAAQKPPLPRKHRERLPRVPALPDDKPPDVAVQCVHVCLCR